MANALDTVADYVYAARVLLQDTYGPAYRYPSAEIVQALNLGLIRARQLRADLFLMNDGQVPFYLADNDEPVPFEVMYREGLLNFIVGQIQLRDDEDTVDSRAAAFKNALVTQLSVGAGQDVSGGGE
jgi:hypothetical protein